MNFYLSIKKTLWIPNTKHVYHIDSDRNATSLENRNKKSKAVDTRDKLESHF